MVPGAPSESRLSLLKLGDHGNSAKAASIDDYIDDLQQGEQDGVMLESGLAHDRDLPALSDVLDVKDGNALPSHQSWINKS